MQDFCTGLIATGGRFCIKKNCKFLRHCTKAWEEGKMYSGFYMHDTTGLAYLELFLPVEIGMRTATGRAVLSKGEQMMKAWAAIFCHRPWN
jgi:hypothetical protein